MNSSIGKEHFVGLLLAVIALIAPPVSSEQRQPLLRGLENDDLPHRKPRIVGGETVANPQERYPYFAVFHDKIMCGGALISKRWVITAAHCAGASSSFEINGKHYTHTREVLHSGYDDRHMNNDIGLYQLSEDLIDTPYLRMSPVKITELSSSMAVIGIGDTKAYLHKTRKKETAPLELKLAELDLVGFADCVEPYVPHGDAEYIDPDSMICAQKLGGDSCQGDSGGPMFIPDALDRPDQDLLVGLVSWGYGCSDMEFPGVYTRVSYHYDWILDNICSVDPEGAPEYVDCNTIINGLVTSVPSTSFPTIPVNQEGSIPEAVITPDVEAYTPKATNPPIKRPPKMPTNPQAMNPPINRPAKLPTNPQADRPAKLPTNPQTKPPAGKEMYDEINCPAVFPRSGTPCVMVEPYKYKKCMYYEMGPDVSCSCRYDSLYYICTGNFYTNVPDISVYSKRGSKKKKDGFLSFLMEWFGGI